MMLLHITAYVRPAEIVGDGVAATLGKEIDS